MCTMLMAGSVAGYAKTHYYLGTPQYKDEKPRRKIIKKISPTKRHQSFQVIKPIK